jgi:serine/threonine protein kinase/Holliday junction resolvase RusA-like endonuclease
LYDTLFNKEFIMPAHHIPVSPSSPLHRSSVTDKTRKKEGVNKNPGEGDSQVQDTQNRYGFTRQNKEDLPMGFSSKDACKVERLDNESQAHEPKFFSASGESLGKLNAAVGMGFSVCIQDTSGQFYKVTITFGGQEEKNAFLATHDLSEITSKTAKDLAEPILKAKLFGDKLRYNLEIRGFLKNLKEDVCAISPADSQESVFKDKGAEGFSALGKSLTGESYKVDFTFNEKLPRSEFCRRLGIVSSKLTADHAQLIADVCVQQKLGRNSVDPNSRFSQTFAKLADLQSSEVVDPKRLSQARFGSSVISAQVSARAKFGEDTSPDTVFMKNLQDLQEAFQEPIKDSGDFLNKLDALVKTDSANKKEESLHTFLKDVIAKVGDKTLKVKEDVFLKKLESWLPFIQTDKDMLQNIEGYARSLSSPKRSIANPTANLTETTKVATAVLKAIQTLRLADSSLSTFENSLKVLIFSSEEAFAERDRVAIKANLEKLKRDGADSGRLTALERVINILDHGGRIDKSEFEPPLKHSIAINPLGKRYELFNNLPGKGAGQFARDIDTRQWFEAQKIRKDDTTSYPANELLKRAGNAKEKQYRLVPIETPVKPLSDAAVLEIKFTAAMELLTSFLDPASNDMPAFVSEFDDLIRTVELTAAHRTELENVIKTVLDRVDKKALVINDHASFLKMLTGWVSSFKPSDEWLTRVQAYAKPLLAAKPTETTQAAETLLRAIENRVTESIRHLYSGNTAPNLVPGAEAVPVFDEKDPAETQLLGKSRYIVSELLNTEEDYLKNLKTLYNELENIRKNILPKDRLKNDVVLQQDLTVFMGGISTLIDISESVISGVKSPATHSGGKFNLSSLTKDQANVLVGWFETLGSVKQSIVYGQCNSLFARLRDTIPALKGYAKDGPLDKAFRQDKGAGKGVDSFLVMPVQRQPRYVMLLTELAKELPDGGLKDRVKVGLKNAQASATITNEHIRAFESCPSINQADIIPLKPSETPKEAAEGKFKGELDVLTGLLSQTNKNGIPAFLNSFDSLVHKDGLTPTQRGDLENVVKTVLDRVDKKTLVINDQAGFLKKLTEWVSILQPSDSLLTRIKDYATPLSVPSRSWDNPLEKPTETSKAAQAVLSAVDGIRIPRQEAFNAIQKSRQDDVLRVRDAIASVVVARKNVTDENREMLLPYISNRIEALKVAIKDLQASGISGDMEDQLHKYQVLLLKIERNEPVKETPEETKVFDLLKDANKNFEVLAKAFGKMSEMELTLLWEKAALKSLMSDKVVDSSALGVAIANKSGKIDATKITSEDGESSANGLIRLAVKAEKEYSNSLQYCKDKTVAYEKASLACADNIRTTVHVFSEIFGLNTVPVSAKSYNELVDKFVDKNETYSDEQKVAKKTELKGKFETFVGLSFDESMKAVFEDYLSPNKYSDLVDKADVKARSEGDDLIFKGVLKEWRAAVQKAVDAGTPEQQKTWLDAIKSQISQYNIPQYGSLMTVTSQLDMPAFIDVPAATLEDYGKSEVKLKSFKGNIGVDLTAPIALKYAPSVVSSLPTLQGEVSIKPPVEFSTVETALKDLLFSKKETFTGEDMAPLKAMIDELKKNKTDAVRLEHLEKSIKALEHGGRVDKTWFSPPLKHTILVSGSGNRYELQNTIDGVKEVIGQGSFGKVRFVRDIRTGELLAVKKIREEDIKDCLHEVEIQKSLGDTEGVLSIRDVIKGEGKYNEQGGILKEKLYVIMPYIQGLDGDKLGDIPKKLSENGLKLLTHGVLFGIANTHAKGIFHRDIKPENFLFSAETGEALLCDFGTAIVGDKAQGVAGSPAFMAPEVIICLDDSETNDDGYPINNWEMADAFSTGVSLCHILAEWYGLSLATPAGRFTESQLRLKKCEMYLAEVEKNEALPLPLKNALIGLLQFQAYNRKAVTETLAGLASYYADIDLEKGRMEIAGLITSQKAERAASKKASAEKAVAKQPSEIKPVSSKPAPEEYVMDDDFSSVVYNTQSKVEEAEEDYSSRRVPVSTKAIAEGGFGNALKSADKFRSDDVVVKPVSTSAESASLTHIPVLETITPKELQALAVSNTPLAKPFVSFEQQLRSFVLSPRDTFINNNERSILESSLMKLQKEVADDTSAEKEGYKTWMSYLEEVMFACQNGGRIDKNWFSQPLDYTRMVSKSGNRYELRNTEDGEKKVIGKGAFGKVRFAVNADTGERLAVKKIAKEKIDESLHEFEMQSKLGDAEGVLPVKDCVRAAGKYTRKGERTLDDKLYIFMPYINGKDGEVLGEAVERLSGNGLRYFLKSVLEGAASAHAKGVYHRDIKPANFLFSQEDGKPRLCDFGTAVPEKHFGGDLKGTPSFMAPEVLAAKENNILVAIDLEKADAFSMGITLYQFVADRFKLAHGPVHGTFGQHNIESKRKGLLAEIEGNKALQKPENMYIRTMLLDLLQMDAANRKTIREVIQSNYLKGDDVSAQAEMIQVMHTITA